MKKESEYAIGIDLGTGSCKIIIIDTSGKSLGFGSSDYFSSSNEASWTDQDPEFLFSVLIQSLKSALEKPQLPPEKCLGISVGGALHSIMAIDSHHQPLSDVFTWADTRSKKQSQNLGTQIDTHAHYLTCGCPNHPMYPLSKIIWFREENKHLFDKTSKFISAKEYILWKLTGEEVVDYAIASGTGLLNIHSLNWDNESLSIAGITKNQMFNLREPTEKIGGLNKAVATLTGLRPNTPVYMGSADAVNSSLGAGTLTPDQLTCMVGTSGAIRTITNEPVLDHQERLWCYAINKNYWISGGAINNGGLAISWLCDTFTQISNAGSPIGFDKIMRWAEDAPAGCDGVICLPFFSQERSPYWNPNMRAVFFGLSLNHSHTHIARAVIEGIGFRLFSVLEVIQEVTRKEKYDIRASGGFTKSEFWVQVLTDIFNQNINIPTTGETSAVGAAFWVLISSGVVKDLNELDSFIEITRTHYPNREVQARYKQSYQVYKDIYFSMRNIYDKYSSV